MNDFVETSARQLLRRQPRVKLFPGDCREVLADMDSSSVHMALTDPRCFLDGLDGEWRKGRGGPRGTGSVGGLPAGLKFDPEQGRKLQAFMTPVATNLIRVLKPGAFALVFSAPRLMHRMAVVFEDAGFEIRDVYAWRFTRRAQFKAISMDHFIMKREGMAATEKQRLIQSLRRRKTRQLRPQFEAVLCAQRPRQGTFVDNWLAFQTGLIDAGQSLHEQVPATVMTVEKEIKAKYNGHLTPKPIRICE